jgi:hypothetical protein
MRVPFFRTWRRRSANGRDILAISAINGIQAAGEPVPADQAAAPPLPRRRPGSHGAKAVKADPAAADPATLRKVIDGLNRI